MGSECKGGDRILVLAIRAIGDVALITPVLRHLKRTFPASTLVILVDGPSAQVLRHNPHLDRIIEIDRARSKQWPWFRRVKDWWNVVSTLRTERFDVVVDLFSGPRSALLGWLAGARERYGEACRHRIRGFLYNRPVSVCRDGRHLVQQKLDVIQPLVGHVSLQDSNLELFLTQEECERGNRLLQVGAHHGPVIGLVPGAGSPWRMWPAERFVELADTLVRIHGARVVLLGGMQDQAVCQRIAACLSGKPINLAGKTTLRELIAVLHQLDLVIANVTGPMHLAVAVDKPRVIALYGAADTVQYAPWGSTATIITKGAPADAAWKNVDYRRDYEWLLKITVNDVLQQVHTLLAESASFTKRIHGI